MTLHLLNLYLLKHSHERQPESHRRRNPFVDPSRRKETTDSFAMVSVLYCDRPSFDRTFDFECYHPICTSGMYFISILVHNEQQLPALQLIRDTISGGDESQVGYYVGIMVPPYLFI
jgi:hypothetical protein